MAPATQLRIDCRALLCSCLSCLLALAPWPSTAVKFTTVCHQQGWWTLSLAPRDKVAALLPHGYGLASPNSSSIGLTWPDDKHPFMLETQTQSNCTESLLPFIHTTFHEFKLEIPFLTKEEGDPNTIFMYKPLLYADTWSDVLGAATVYGLNIHKADSMKQSDSSFDITYEHDFFKANFNATSAWRPAEASAEKFKVFEYITTLPWLCKNAASCAYNRYDLNSTLLRPSDAAIRFGTSILPDLGLTTVTVTGIDVNVFGAVQLDAILHISEVTSCP